MMLPARDRMLVVICKGIKNSHKLTDDITIELLRDEMQFNMRIKNVSQGYIYGTRTEVLLDHNSFHPVSAVNDHDIELPEGYELYSIYKSEVYAYRHEDSESWFPHTWKDDKGDHGFLIVERVWQPYQGLLAGIDPTVIENRLFVVGGKYLHHVVATGRYCDYTVVYQESNGREAYLCRMRDNSDECLGIDKELTEGVLSGRYLIGETATTAKKFKN